MTEFEKIINMASGIPPNTASAVEPEPGRKFIYPLTDHGNATFFARIFLRKVKYVAELGIWIVWENKRWVRQDIGGKKALARIVKRYILKLYDSAKSEKSLYTFLDEPVSIDEAWAWAKDSSKAGRIKAMFELAKDMPGISVSQADLDGDPFLLGVSNGVVDLQTGKLIANRSEYLITRYARPAYRPEAMAPLFERFISEACIGRQDLVDFVQDLLGYVLSGLTSEQAFFILLGTGANGKSTLVETFFYLLGEYAKGLPSHAFIKSESRAIRNDLARLPGVRFAPCAEVNTGKALDESAVKRTTGGDVMTARFIGKEYFDFHLVSKFFFSVNTLPRVTGADNGIYRRLTVIPFDADFQENMDTKLPDKLKGEADGILAWAVRGFMRWHARGYLEKPYCVVEACKAYRAEMDTVQSFINDQCEVDANASTPLGVLYEEYTKWAKDALVQSANLHLFGTLMQQKGFRKHKSGCWRWKGIKLKQVAVNPVVASIFSAPAQTSQAIATN